ncbi:neuromedin-B-like [Anguilla anguilla]|uniref:neuromedin-B-like n=1 Tax=Anguilla anguilla TaxID=7936 RepID=UPI0015B099D0|nr:neuromedin-B-like [Anguilla anguilla]
MAGVIWSSICKFVLLIHLFFFSYISKTSSVSLDLTELRNKVAKIKVNPRGNLWATGHFMGKKSVMEGSLLESPDEESLNAIQTALNSDQHVQELRELITQEVLKFALQNQLQDTRRRQDNYPDTGLLLKLLENYIGYETK